MRLATPFMDATLRVKRICMDILSHIVTPAVPEPINEAHIRVGRYDRRHVASLDRQANRPDLIGIRHGPGRCPEADPGFAPPGRPGFPSASFAPEDRPVASTSTAAVLVVTEIAGKLPHRGSSAPPTPHGNVNRTLPAWNEGAARTRTGAAYRH